MRTPVRSFGFVVFLGLASVACPASADPSLVLPELPRLELTLPTLTLTTSPQPRWLLDDASREVPSEHSSLWSMLTSRYWQRSAPLPAGYLPDAELTWRFDALSWRSDHLVLDVGADFAPTDPANCPPDCKTDRWSSRLRFGYDLGTVGVIQHVSPFFELQRRDGALGPRSNVGDLRMRVGMGGKF